MAVTHQADETRGRLSGSESTADDRPTWLRWSVALALVVAVALGFGLGWLVFGGGGDATGDTGTFPTGRFVNRYVQSHTFEFDDDGTYLYCEGASCVSGMFGVQGDLYTEMTHDAGGYRMVPATYRWVFEGGELTFELVGEDVLGDRAAAMSGIFVTAD